MYIQPIGQIGLISNSVYKGDLAYNHTALFQNKIEQQNYFEYHAYRYTNYQYNKERNSFIIGDNIKNVSNYSYMWFNNGRSDNNIFENKRFYAFITGVKYVNNNATEITFKIDIIQTYLYDVDVPECLVEREHTLTDNLFEHIVPENINVDEVITNYEISIFPLRLLCAIVLDKKFPEYDLGEGNLKYNPQLTYAGDSVSTDGQVLGTLNTLYWYCGFPLTIKDVGYFKGKPEYKTQPLYFTQDNIPFDTDMYNGEICASRILRKIEQGQYGRGDTQITAENIVAVYLYPDTAAIKEDLRAGTTVGFNREVAFKNIILENTPVFSFAGKNYTPKNKKLYTYPFSYVELYNNAGENIILKHENFSDEINEYRTLLNVISTNVQPASIVVYPANYANDQDDFEKCCVFSNFPPVFYKGDVFAEYMQAHGNKITATFIGNLLGAISSSVLVGAKISNPISAYTVGSSGVASYIQNDPFFMMQDLKNTPPETHANFSVDILHTALKKYGVTIKNKTIKPDIAKMIDDYFTINGYKVSVIKKPNIFEYIINNVKIRPAFNYIKTANAFVKIKANTENTMHEVMCDSTMLDEFARILNKGITFWSNITGMGDYSLSNLPIEEV